LFSIRGKNGSIVKLSDSALTELRPGLLRWTARHPAAVDDPDSGGPDDWPPDVGCVAYLADDALVLVDPLLPAEAGATPWPELESLAAERGGRTAVLTTIRFHGRSREAAIERFGATTEPPAGVTPMPIAATGETMLWVEEHRALIPGDLLLGDPAGGVRLCPESWLYYLDGVTLDHVRRDLEPLLDLPVELVVVSHGEPVLSDGRTALERALR
jgi:glyoxylase-like metal-dependent hydrolase (beta-lactamase superfamily II)